MLVIVSLRRLDNDRIEIGVARPQHDSNPTHNYASEKEVQAVLSEFGISEETIASHLKLLSQMGATELLRFSLRWMFRKTNRCLEDFDCSFQGNCQHG